MRSNRVDEATLETVSYTPGAQNSPPPSAIPPPTGAPAGWYEDPWHQAAWRWYDGHVWTGHINGTRTAAPTPAAQVAAATVPVAQVPAVPVNKPFLPAFLSWPVLLAALPSLGFMGWVLVTATPAFALGFIPLFIVMPVLLWIDRIEPEPWSSKIHTFLWGTFVAGIISVIVNTVVAIAAGEAVAAVASAPIIEEITKGLAIVWMVRRHEVDGPMDGIVYAGWSALGFAMIENMSFFQFALQENMLVETFVGRALFTPFAHPLFTMWTGLAIGLAIRARKSPWTGLWGLPIAMGLHALWNGSLTFAESNENGPLVLGVTILLFVVLFISSGIGIARLRRRDQRRYQQLIPFLASRYQMDPDRVSLLLDTRARRMARVQIKDKTQLRRFKMESSAMVRLAALLDHDDMPTPADEARLYSQLVAARTET